MKSDRINKELYLNGLTPQEAIKHLTDVINRIPYPQKRFLIIEEYEDDYGNPFEQNPARLLRIVSVTPEEMERRKRRS